ncbi:MAG: hypothetical protein EOP24_27625 [Hyphomicrobiales bacterium]|nr:MAG: hypothetical protein EOP24_27625 [Hyphomicrobiales bacterium]
MNDGAGAQLHRVLGIFALSRAIGASYLHTPVENVLYRGVPGTFDPDQTELLAGLQRLAPLASDTDVDHLVARARVVKATTFSLSEHHRDAGTREKPTLFKVAYPFKILDRVPAYWRAAQRAVPSLPPRRGDVLKIAVHIRRGDVHFVDKHRMLPNSYYLGVLERVIAICRSIGRNYAIDIFSESLATGTTLRPEDFAPGMSRQSFVVSGDLDNFGEFGSLGPINYRINEDLISTIRAMTEADVLVTSKSSMSVVAGLLQQSGIVLFHPFWHSALPDWVITKPDGSFDADRVTRLLLSQP